MKTKEESVYFKLKKPLSALILSILMLCMLSITAPLYAQGNSNDMIVENYNLINEYSDKISQSITKYSELDTSPGKSVSISVAEKMNTQRSALFELQSHADVSTRLLSSEIQAAYSRAEATGRISWIYYYNIPSISSSDALARIEEKYLAHLSKISTLTDAAVVDATANVACTEFNRAIYTEKIKALALATDSIDVAAVISGAIDSLQATSATDLFAQSLTLIFDQAIADVKLQRTRDSITYELSEIFKVIYPDETFNSNETTTLFVYKIKNAKAVSQMNKALCDTIFLLMQEKIKGDYSAIYVGKLNESIADASSRATNEGVGTSILTIFENYTLNYQKSLSKDIVKSLLLSSDTEIEDTLKNIEAVFNSDGGSIDRCQSISALELETECAKYIRLVYDEISFASEKLLIFLDGYDTGAFSTRLNTIQSNAFERLLEKKNEQASFAAECNAILQNVKSDVATVLRESRAERFLLDNKAILQKPKDSICVTDELSLRSAISEYLKLDATVQSALRGQIESIAEKYNILTCLKIRCLLPDDSFYLDLAELLCIDVKNLSATSIDVFYNNCNRIYSKSETLKIIIQYYRQLCASEIYPSLSSSEKQELANVCRASGENLRQIIVEDALDFEEKISELSQSTTLSIDRINECAKIRISTRGSQGTAIKAIVAEANAKIKSSDNKNEMASISEKAIFKINRELTKEAISKASEKLKTQISSMNFLSDEEKSTHHSQIKSICSSACNDAGVSENITVLSFVWNTFTESINEISKEANAQDLTRAIKSYTELFDQDTADLKSSLDAMAHLTNESRGDFYNYALLLSSQFKSAAALCSSSDKVKQEYSKYFEQLNSLGVRADTENVSNYKGVVKEKLENFKSLKDNYSVENYNRLEQEVAKAIQKLQACQTLSDCNDVFNSTTASIEKIADLLDDAKSRAKSQLDAAIRLYRASSSAYSQENFLILESTYNDAIKKIAEYKSISDISKINEYVTNILIMMSGTNKDIIFTASEAETIAGQSPSYPVDYDFANGYWGCIYQADGIASDAALTITSADGTPSIQAIIRKMARQNAFISSAKIPEQTLNALKSCKISLGIDISLSSMSSASGKYTVRMLLPDSVANENILGIVFVDQNNNVEFYNITKDKNLISFDLSHFSKYYIVSESTTDLTPLIKFLTILLSFEFVILLFASALHIRRKRKEKSMSPLLRSIVFSPALSFHALSIQPRHGVSLCVLLGVCAIALGCGIAFLARLELKAIKRERLKNVPNFVDASTDVEHSTKINEQKLLVQKQEIPILCGANAELLPEHEPEFEISQEKMSNFDEHSTNFHSSNLRRAEVNLDAIAQVFDDGAFVSIDSLKEKRLIGKRTEYVKILARGTLTKPLIIEAHDFSRAAEEMLTAIGGEAIKIKAR